MMLVTPKARIGGHSIPRDTAPRLPRLGKGKTRAYNWSLEGSRKTQSAWKGVHKHSERLEEGPEAFRSRSKKITGICNKDHTTHFIHVMVGLLSSVLLRK
jgi:hypothetical protein